MSDLSLDYGELDRARVDIDDAARTFARAGKVASDIAGLVGHPGLASKVNEFENAWDISRDRLQESLEFISDTLTSVVDTFRELDEAQARALASGSK